MVKSIEKNKENETINNYPKFLNGLKKKNIEKEYFDKNYKYVGCFTNKNTIVEKNNNKIFEKTWKNFFGDNVKIPEIKFENKCICETPIKNNYLLIDLKKFEEEKKIEHLIIGSVCVVNFNLNGQTKLKLCSTKNCNERHKNRKEYCNKCKVINKQKTCIICRTKKNKGERFIENLYCSKKCKYEDANNIYIIMNDKGGKDVKKALERLKIDYEIDTNNNIIFNGRFQYDLLDYFNTKHKIYKLSIVNKRNVKKPTKFIYFNKRKTNLS